MPKEGQGRRKAADLDDQRAKFSAFLRSLVRKDGRKDVRIAKRDLIARSSKKYADIRKFFDDYYDGTKRPEATNAFAIGEALFDCNVVWCSGLIALRAAGHFAELAMTLAFFAHRKEKPSWEDPRMVSDLYTCASDLSDTCQFDVVDARVMDVHVNGRDSTDKAVRDGLEDFRLRISPRIGDSAANALHHALTHREISKITFTELKGAERVALLEAFGAARTAKTVPAHFKNRDVLETIIAVSRARMDLQSKARAVSMLFSFWAGERKSQSAMTKFDELRESTNDPRVAKLMGIL